MKDFLSKKGIGFYLGFASAVLSIVVAITYILWVNSDSSFSDYWNSIAFILALAGGVSFIALSIFDITTPFAPVVLGVLSLITFCVFIRASYMYFTVVFYGGVNIESILNIDIGFIICLLGTIINIGLSIASIFNKQLR